MPIRKQSTPRSVRLPAFAKINLSLNVLGRRADGYHELRTIFQTISLHDTLELSRSSRPGVALETDDPSLPSGPENLVCRAIEAIGRELDFRGGVRARLQKRIPVARGLGGGSSDAAAALIGMMRLTKKKGAARAADGNRRRTWRGRSFFPFWRSRTRGESRRRNLSPCRSRPSARSWSFLRAISASARKKPTNGPLRN